MYSIEIKNTRRVFEYCELSEFARIVARDELADMYINQFNAIQESIDSATHAANVLGLQYHYPLCATYEDMPIISVKSYENITMQGLDIDAISDGYWIGEGVKESFKMHYDALVKAEEIADRLDNARYEAAYNAEMSERSFSYGDMYSYDTIARMVEKTPGMFTDELKHEIAQIKDARDKYLRLDSIADIALAKFEAMYKRVAIESLESAFRDICIEYTQYYNDEYYKEYFSEIDDAPLFDESGHMTEYTLADVLSDSAA